MTMSNNGKAPRTLIGKINTDVSLQTVRELGRRGAINPVYALVTDNVREQFGTQFPDAYMHDLVSACYNLPAKEFENAQPAFSNECQKTYNDNYQRLFDIFCRFWGNSKYSVSEINMVLYDSLRYWNWILDECNVELVLLWTMPHLMADASLYYLCKQKKIEVICLAVSPYETVPGSFTELDMDALADDEIARNVETYSYDAAAAIVDDLLGKFSREHGSAQHINKFNLERCFSHNCIYDGVKNVKALLKPLYADLARILKENIDGIQSRYIRYGNPLDAVSSGSKFQKTIFQYTVAREFFLRKKNYYKYKSLSSRADLSVNYIYYPLASQPECSTIPAGNEFSFQLIAANALAFALPPGWKLYIKEHPAQFAASHAEASYRPTQYYRALAELPNTLLADIATNPYDLIDNAKAVASFSMGSTTFEALARGKPVVLGGKAWYRDAPGIIAVDSVDDVKRALDLVSKGAHVDRQETREYLIKVMMHKTYPVLPPDKYGDPLFTRRAVDDLSRSIAHRVTSLFN